MASVGLKLTMCKIPTVLFFGQKDNWGGRRQDSFMWSRKQRVRSGNANGGMKTIHSIEEWVTNKKEEGCPIKMVFYEEAGHSFHSVHWKRCI